MANKLIIHKTNARRECNEVKDMLFGLTDGEKAAILESIPDPVMLVDTDLKIVWSNATMNMLFNLSADQSEGRHCFEKIYGLKSPCDVCPVLKAINTGQPCTLDDFSSLGKRWMLRAYPLRDVEGNITRVVEIVTDITKRKLAEEALEKRIVALTRPLDDIKNIAFEDLFNLSDFQRLQDMLADSWGVAVLLTRPDGTAITQPSNFTYFCKFIRKNEKGFRNCQNSDAKLGRYNPSGPIIHKCLSAGLWGAGANITIGGRHIANWLIGQVRNEAQSEKEIMEYARDVGIDEDAFREAFLQVPVMPQKKFEQIAHALFAMANQLSVIAYQNIQQSRFIFDRIQAEEALQKSEEKFRGIYEESPIGIELYDREGTLLDVNKACLDIFGISEATAVKGFKLFDDPNLGGEFKAQLQRGENVHYESIFDFERVTALNLYETTKRGIIYLDVLITPLRGIKKESDAGYLVHVRDITDRKHAEEALQESEKQVRRKLDAILSPEGDIGTLELSDIIDMEKTQKLMDEFFDLTNLPMTITDLKGKVLVGIGWQDICTNFHRVNPESCRLCMESDIELTSNVPVGTFKKYRCKNNMWDIATPIMLGDKCVGNIFMGQFLFADEKPDYETFRQQARKYGFDEQEYIAALDRVPHWSEKTINKAMSFFTIFAGIIGNLGYSNIKLANTLEECKRAEEALRESETKYRRLHESMTEAFAVGDVNGRIREFNRAYQSMLGYSGEELRRLTFIDITPAKWHALEKSIVEEQIMIHGYSNVYEKEYKRKDGSVFPVEVSAFLIHDDAGNPAGMWGIVRDITERKRMEAELNTAKDYLTTVFNNVYDAIFVHDLNGKIIDVNDKMLEMYKVSRKEAMDYNVIRDYSATDESMEESRSNWNKVMFGENIFTEWKARRPKDGSVFDVEVFLTKLALPDGEYILANVRDVTERKRAEEARQESEEKYNQFFKTSRDCVFITKDGSLIDINDAAVELLGYSSREELLQMKIPDLYAEQEEWIKHSNIISECGYSKEYPADFRRKDGSIRHTLVTSAARYDTNGNLIGFQGTVRDITAQRRNEEELKKYREKLEVLVAERTRELEDKTKNLQEINTALNVLLRKRAKDKKDMEENFVANIGTLVLPYLERIRKNNLDAQQQFCLDTVEKNLEEIVSPLLKNIQQFNLTPREIQIAYLIKDGKTTKEIAKALGIVEGSIATHRKNIRKKLGLDRASNLQSQLRFLEK